MTIYGLILILALSGLDGEEFQVISRLAERSA